ncbi:glycerol-3-phosphate dehydrogenase/oxidase [Comamonas testosteroni]|uniref:Aerobic glycerol-3-phosphate dehydrogenase n=1 Tax=Comamonas testosteroni TaxID=285 RepID=A0A8B4SA20_COMTE|nr:glycerol-3-phosphate dehydrogenase/oxidase [Comamonas testosteroni]EHN67054.1 FAD dependent oxidoreductase [Comamonas testosteroni ATCC 11996]QQN71397.1 glycerol-3-phosphate dehydrogenase/oxidase [Comamonas testosteroni]SUY79962.1 Aerobic glycerol-3-phosphate dehydrogenase [Comamonas testosteroni]
MNQSTQPLATTRAQLLERLAQTESFDLAIVGGGATGLGVAVDAAARGFKVLLLESLDFAKGTSSRATKLVHGGVRYLAQGNISLVREALHERTTLLHNAPHLAQPLAFVMPSYKLLDTPFYGIGLKMYDALAGKAGLGSTEFLSSAKTVKYLPTVQQKGLKGGVKYWDGQFDDARLALALARTAAAKGALLINYCPAEKLIYENDQIAGLICRDAESGRNFTVRAKCVVNATGPWVDLFRQQDAEAQGKPVKPMVAPSQGVHVVVDREFLPTDHALLIPKTADGRVLFAVPWLGKVILGTTDTPRHDLAREPLPFPEELDFILGEAGKYLNRQPTLADVRSMWVGLRPLVKPQDDDGENTKKISREHTVMASKTGLVTVTGGKWTTYRAMSEDVLAECFQIGRLPSRPAGVTVNLPLVGAPAEAAVTHSMNQSQGLHSYGTDAAAVAALPGAQNWLMDGLSEAMVRFAARFEYARTVEDMLARRSRLLFLDARKAAEIAPRVAAILTEELGQDVYLNDFLALTRQYLPAQG